MSGFARRYADAVEVAAAIGVSQAAQNAALAAATGDTLLGVTPGNDATPTTFSIWIKQQVAIAENFASVQVALNSGAKIVKLTLGNYNQAAPWEIPSGVTLEANGKANTSLTCTANITPLRMSNVNDAGVEGLLVIANAAQTAPIVEMDANGVTMARCRVRDVQVSGLGTDFPFISVVARGGAVGSWAHVLDDLSASGCGTLFKGETQAAGSWINSVGMQRIHANDFIRGMHLLATAGDGVSDCTFLDWRAQTSARTQFGGLVTDVVTQGTNRKNSFTDVRWYDLISTALSYYIGDNVLDTSINGLMVDEPSALHILDKGINTRFAGVPLFEHLTRKGRMVGLHTDAGLTSSLSGTATAATTAGFAQLRTGATAGSVARLFSTNAISGLCQGDVFSVDFGKPVRLSFLLSRISGGASVLGRVQLKTTTSDGQLVAKGLGLQLTNYDLFGETFGTSLNTLSLGTAMVDSQSYKVEIVSYPSVRVEWWVNGVLKAVETTAGKLPSATAACYLHASLNNVAAVDVQMLMTAIDVRTEL